MTDSDRTYSTRPDGIDEQSIRVLIAAHLGVEPQRATDGALFQHDLGADSLDLIELTMLLENDLGVDIGDEESEHCLCVGDALRLLRTKLAVLESRV